MAGHLPIHLDILQAGIGKIELRGQLFQLVRLQFQPGALWSGAHVFRHGESGAVVALSDDGGRYRADGQVDGAGGVFDPEGGWTAGLEFREAEVAGTPIWPTGEAVRQEVSLPRSAWRQVLAPGDPVLHLHIPAGSPMDFDACGDSLRAALEFFPRSFPDLAFRAFACSSWLLDAQLDGLLPATSNIARFQREVYLLPGRGDGRSTLERVFGGVPADLRQAPRDTALRRAILDHLLAGRHLRNGRCFLLPEDLDWGAQVYRRQPPMLLRS